MGCSSSSRCPSTSWAPCTARPARASSTCRPCSPSWRSDHSSSHHLHSARIRTPDATASFFARPCPRMVLPRPALVIPHKPEQGTLPVCPWHFPWRGAQLKPAITDTPLHSPCTLKEGNSPAWRMSPLGALLPAHLRPPYPFGRLSASSLCAGTLQCPLPGRALGLCGQCQGCWTGAPCQASVFCLMGFCCPTMPLCHYDYTDIAGQRQILNKVSLEVPGGAAWPSCGSSGSGDAILGLGRCLCQAACDHAPPFRSSGGPPGPVMPAAAPHTCAWPHC